MDDLINSYIARSHDVVARVPRGPISALGQALLRAYRNDKQVFTLGNGGSASTASHMAADLVKNTIGPHMRRFRITSLNENTAIMTALANDIGYEFVFSEQLTEVIRPADLLIVVSASGNSPNVLEAIRYARAQSAEVGALLGFDGGKAAELADIAIVVPSDNCGIVEDVHLMINHMLVEYLLGHLAGSRTWTV
jgi:D-sedoheptulose 7-phosphate isomerase